MNRKLVLWFAVVLVVLLANSIVLYGALRKLIANDHQVRHTYQVLIELDATLSNLQDAETGQRGYLLTGQKDYLTPYHSGISSIDQHLNTLKQLTADSPEEHQSVVILSEKAGIRLVRLSEGINALNESGFESARQVILSNAGKQMMDDIRQDIASMRSYESELLLQRAAESRASVLQAELTLLVISILALVMLMIFYYQVRKSISERAQLLLEEQTAHAAAEKAHRTEQVARAEAERANRLKDEFLATVSHELRTPLTSLLGWSRMLRSGKLDEQTTQRALETIERNAQSQAQLVEDLLDGSRIITGKLRLAVRSMEPLKVIEGVLDTVRPAAEGKQIRITTVLDPSAGPVSGDPERLQQVVWNLLANAIKFTPKGGQIQVRLERVNSHVEIIVSDSGQGISPEFLPFVFDRFRQANSSTSRSIGGLGLGLAIARHLVEMHGGSIHVDSPGEGLGATFTVRLPVIGVRLADSASAGEERAHPTAGSAAAFDILPSLSGLRILAVDDQPDTLLVVGSLLEQSGAEVQTATSASSALDSLGKWAPDLIVADIGMPGEDGYSLIRKIRALPRERGGDIPAIALTAYARVEDRLRTLNAGYQMHVPKPVEPIELITVVASLTGRIGDGSAS